MLLSYRVTFLCNVLGQIQYTSESPVRYFGDRRGKEKGMKAGTSSFHTGVCAGGCGMDLLAVGSVQGNPRAKYWADTLDYAKTLLTQ